MEVNQIEVSISALRSDNLNPVEVPSFEADVKSPKIVISTGDGITRILRRSVAQCKTMSQFERHFKLVLGSLSAIKKLQAFESDEFDVAELPECLSAILKHCDELEEVQMLRHDQTLMPQFRESLHESVGKLASIAQLQVSVMHEDAINLRRLILQDFRDNLPTFDPSVALWEQFLTQGAPGIPADLTQSDPNTVEDFLPLKSLQAMPDSALDLSDEWIKEYEAIEGDIETWLNVEGSGANARPATTDPEWCNRSIAPDGILRVVKELAADPSPYNQQRENFTEGTLEDPLTDTQPLAVLGQDLAMLEGRPESINEWDEASMKIVRTYDAKGREF